MTAHAALGGALSEERGRRNGKQPVTQPLAKSEPIGQSEPFAIGITIAESIAIAESLAVAEPLAQPESVAVCLAIAEPAAVSSVLRQTPDADDLRRPAAAIYGSRC